jgi:NitT/TauT family transport system ATP-binding protein/sulfonate transport system ATP-binding protein
MKQRVGIARAYANKPEVMLLDEPFGQLDAQTRLFMEKETERIWQTDRRTVVFVTNNIDEAIILGDRIVTLDGKLPGRMGNTIYNVDFERPREPTDIDFLRLRHEITEASELIL